MLPANSKRKKTHDTKHVYRIKLELQLIFYYAQSTPQPSTVIIRLSNKNAQSYAGQINTKGK